MTIARALLVLGLMVASALAIVALRTESAKVAYRIQVLHQRKLSLEYRLWSQEMELARLRVPDEIRRRIQELGIDVVEPTESPPQRTAPRR